MARLRSPNYPSLSIKQAIDMVAKIYRTERTNVIHRDDAAKAMGYSGLTGRSMTVLGALIHFDLLNKVGKGEVRVSEIAERILHGITTEERDEATLKAAFAPQLFQSIHSRFPEGIPSEGTIKSFLMREGFSDAAVGPAINAFMETYREVENIRESESLSDEDKVVTESPTQPPAVQLQPVQVPPIAAMPSTLSGLNDGPLDYNLSSAGLAVSGMTNSASELKDYIARLQSFIPLLPDQEKPL